MRVIFSKPGTLGRLWRPYLLCALALLCWGCPSHQVDPAYEQLVERQGTFVAIGDLGPGDKFNLRVFHEPELSGAFTVSPDGTINYPYIGRISVIGKTCADLEGEVTRGARALAARAAAG